MAFKQALAAALQKKARATGESFDRVQQLFLFERFLARLDHAEHSHFVVKGGVALELRLERARTTRDIDLRWAVDAVDHLERLARAGRLDLGDFLWFEVRLDAEHTDFESERYEGRRFRVAAHLGNKPYGANFGLDVITGGKMIREPDVIPATELHAIPGIEPVELRVLPAETHVAEKLHAYSLPREANSRVKDLPDIALLASTGSFDAGLLRSALEQTFGFRDTHVLPSSFPEPPNRWERDYARMASENRLPWPDLESVTAAARAFMEPVLTAEVVGGVWSPEHWEWQPKG